MHYTSIRILKPRRQLQTRKIQTRENSGTSKQNSSRASEPSSKVYLRISAVLAIFVLLIGGASNSLHYVSAYDNTDQNKTNASGKSSVGMVGAMQESGPGGGTNLSKVNATMHAFKSAMEKAKQKFMEGMKKVREAGLGSNSTLLQGNATAHAFKSGERKGHDAVIDSVMKTYNHSVRQAQHDENIVLKQAQQNLQGVMKQARESMQQSNVAGGNTTLAKGNATAGLGANTNSAKTSVNDLSDANKPYRKSVGEARADYQAAVKKANQDARAAIMQLREQSKAAMMNKTAVNAMTDERATFWKEYFNIVTHRTKATADARETLQAALANAILAKFKALGADTPALDSAVQDYKNTVDHVIQKFEGTVDAANEHVKSEIDTKFSLSTTK